MGAATGSLVDQALRSRALLKTMRLRVYLPPYFDRRMRCPVVYLLHPWGQDERYWTDHLRVHEVADRLILAGAMPPFVAAMPQGDKSFFINAANPGGDFSPVLKLDPLFFDGALEGYGDYGDYLLNDVLPAVEAEFHTRTDRAGRVIAGISMGAAGAATLAFTHPQRFGTVGIHSPALFTDEHLGPPWIFGLGDAEAFARRDPTHLAAALDPQTAPRIYLDCGLHDEMADATYKLHEALTIRGIRHTYISRLGGHNFDYWQANLAEYLGFYAAGW